MGTERKKSETENAPGLLLIISGPSGVGKTTIAREVEKRLGGVFSVSTTTRPKAPHDQQGIDYYFVDHEAFDRLRGEGAFLEWAEVFGNCYGTPRDAVEKALNEGRLMILEIDVKGAMQVKSNMPDAFAMFIRPPDEQDLLERLRARKRDKEQVIQSRFAQARDEMHKAETCGAYDVFLVNDDLEPAIERAVLRVREELERRRGGGGGN
ncbi:MAG: guanylate kinase [Phycisphaeraceae bacterium]|nr:guanylate kinase [Phycisphaeraceae bacterium]